MWRDWRAEKACVDDVKDSLQNEEGVLLASMAVDPRLGTAETGYCSLMEWPNSEVSTEFLCLLAFN